MMKILLLALLTDEYKGIDWEEIYETYYNAKKGSM